MGRRWRFASFLPNKPILVTEKSDIYLSNLFHWKKMRAWRQVRGLARAVDAEEAEICRRLDMQYRTEAKPGPKSGPFWVGKVLHTQMDKTAVVQVDYYVKYPKYGKYVTQKRHTKFKVHDEGEWSVPGDIVQIRHSRPYSKTKSAVLWRIVRPDAGTEFIQSHPEFAITRSKAIRSGLIKQLAEAEKKGWNAEEMEALTAKSIEEAAEGGDSEIKVAEDRVYSLLEWRKQHFGE